MRYEFLCYQLDFIPVAVVYDRHLKIIRRFPRFIWEVNNEDNTEVPTVQSD